MVSRTVTSGSKRAILLLVLAAAMLPATASARLRVVTTTQDPGSIVKAIGGDRVAVTTLCKGFQDPHFLDAKPSYMLELNEADLLVVIGLGLEIGSVPTLTTGARNDKVLPGKAGFLDLSTGITPLEVLPIADRSQGDIHPNGNPHYWSDPENGRIMAREIGARLDQLDPDGKATYDANLAAWEKQLDAKEALWAAQMAPLKGAKIVTYHESWPYFARRYDLEIVDQVEPKPGIPPTPAHTLDLIRLMQDQKVKIILMESFYDAKVAQLIADKTGARLLVVPGSVHGDPGVPDYFALIDEIVAELSKTAKS